MDMKTYLKQASANDREALAAAVGSSVGYFYLIGGGHRRPSTDLCKRLVVAEAKLTLEELRPDIWSASAPNAFDQPDADLPSRSPPRRRPPTVPT